MSLHVGCNFKLWGQSRQVNAWVVDGTVNYDVGPASKHNQGHDLAFGLAVSGREWIMEEPSSGGSPNSELQARATDGWRRRLALEAREREPEEIDAPLPVRPLWFELSPRKGWFPIRLVARTPAFSTRPPNQGRPLTLIVAVFEFDGVYTERSAEVRCSSPGR